MMVWSNKAGRAEQQGGCMPECLYKKSSLCVYTVFLFILEHQYNADTEFKVQVQELSESGSL